MKHYYIYKIICLCDEWNGKFYIGEHYGELNDNYTGSGRLIKEYFDTHEKIKGLTYDKEILEVGDENNICDLEIDYIREGMESELCLNLVCVSSRGAFNKSWKLSDETKLKMRKPKSEEHRRKIGESNKGKKLSEETKNKMRKPKSDETKQKMSEAKKGRVYSEEHRKKMSEAHKLYWKNKKADNENQR